MGGRGLGRVCDHINHLGYHIKEIRLLKARGPAKLKGPGDNTAVSAQFIGQVPSMVKMRVYG